VATGKRDIYCDLSKSAFVANQLNSQATSIAGFFHQDKPTVAIHPLEADPTRAANQGAYSQLDPTGWSASLKVYSSAGTLLASQTVWTVSGNTLVGSLDLNTVAMASEFASSSTTQIENAVFEVKLTDGTGAEFNFQSRITIKRQYNVAGSPVATPSARYYTVDEINALFVRFTGNPDGSSITLRSSNGDYEVVLQCNDDGSNASNAAG
jgi:hypothetical protein